MALHGPSDLVTNAQLFRLEVYGVGSTCAALPATPMTSQTFAKGAEVSLGVSSGHHALVLTSYSDSEGKIPLGRGCVEEDLSAGSKVCLQLTLVAVKPVDAGVPDMRSVDLSGADLTVPPVDQSVPDLVAGPDLFKPDLLNCLSGDLQCGCALDTDCQHPLFPRCGPAKVCVACTTTPTDNCPLGQFCNNNVCNSGCKANKDCSTIVPPPDGGVSDGGSTDGGTSVTLNQCDVNRHVCVECLLQTDCPMGKVCSQSGLCTDGCDLSMGKTCPSGFSCCNKVCIDTRNDALNCGGCGFPCTGSNTLCCNMVCVDPQNDKTHCGNCNTSCIAFNGTPSCSGGQCTWACNQFFNHCQTGNTGCETLTTTLNDCGGCGQKCDTTNALNATCDGTTCAYSCKPTFGDCSKVPPNTNGCEALLNTASNCTACGAACDTLRSNGAACDGTKCTYTSCKGSNVDCDMTGLNTNGCEADLTSPSTCGSCSVSCDTVRSNGAACNAGACTYTSCKAGFKDCSMTSPNADGCETPITTINDCGGCGNRCDTTNANNATCDGTTCSYSCKSFFKDCQMTAPNLNGCETSLTSTTTCGDCNNVCDTVNSTGVGCDGTKCTYSGCAANRRDCMTTAPDTNGCETNLTSPTTCGGCNNVCDTANSTVSGCDGTKCLYSGCAANRQDCDTAAPNINGCETDLLSTTNCGACGVTCNPVNATASSCSTGACTYTCASTHLDCVKTGQNLDGCETSRSTSDCGACGVSCSGLNATSTTCDGTKCVHTCDSTHFDCNGAIGPNTDGCECTMGCNGTACLGGTVNHTNCIGAACTATLSGQNLGQPYTHPNVVGTPGNAATYNSSMADNAAAAWMHGAVSSGTCGGQGVRAVNTGNSCTVWVYAGTLAGYVRYNSVKQMNNYCFCPTDTTFPTWN